MFTVVFVCTGNTCRSPMAEAIARDVLGDLASELEVESAGLAATGGQPASNHARFVVANRGGDLDGHLSRTLDGETLSRADLVLTMTRAHRDEVRSRVRNGTPEVYTIAEFAGEDSKTDVLDPFGGSLEDYERTYEQIRKMLEAARPVLSARVRAANHGADAGRSNIAARGRVKGRGKGPGERTQK